MNIIFYTIKAWIHYPPDDALIVRNMFIELLPPSSTPIMFSLDCPKYPINSSTRKWEETHLFLFIFFLGYLKYLILEAGAETESAHIRTLPHNVM